MDKREVMNSYVNMNTGVSKPNLKEYCYEIQFQVIFFFTSSATGKF